MNDQKDPPKTTSTQLSKNFDQHCGLVQQLLKEIQIFN